MTESELLAYLKSQYPKENESCEWKAFSNLKHSVSGSNGDDMISYVSAISNASGGVLVIGVEDKTLKLLGIDNFNDYTPENIPARLMGNCTNLSSEGLFLEQFITEDTNKTIWVLNIPKHSPRRPVYAHKKAWQRKGDNLIEMTSERHDTILNEPLRSIDDWSAGICEDATFQDLDQKAIAKARENYKNKFSSQASDVDSWDDITFLNKAKVTIKGKITRTAILLLGKSEAEHFINPAEAKIRWILKDKDGVEKDYEIFTCPFLLSGDELYAKVRNLKYRYIKEDSLFPEEVDQYEPYIIREALNNCIAHQDYSNRAGRINVVEKDDELVFSNVGSFIPGSVENVIKDNAPEEVYRNPMLATAMCNLKMVDTIGSGIRRMFTVQRSKFFPMPEYDLTNGKVKVTITGKVLDMNYAKALARNPELNLQEIIMLDKVQKKLKITDDEFKYLKNKGLVEGTKKNFFIAVRIAQKAGQKAAYTKSKAFTQQQYFDWIIQGIKHHSFLTRKDIDGLLWTRLSDLYDDEEKKKKKINNIISAMRTKGIIENIGNDNKPKWILIDDKEIQK